MVPRAGIEPATRGFSVHAYGWNFKALALVGVENRPGQIKGLAGKGKTFVRSKKKKAPVVVA